MYDIAVIIINYNSAAYTIQCVASIIEHSAKALQYQIIVVDNASASADFEQLKALEHYQAPIQIIRNERNTGFAGGNMAGTQYADARYYFFLNNDTLLLNDCLTLLTRFMELNPNTGICTPQMFNTDGSFHFSFTYHPTASTYWLGTGLLKIFRPGAYPSKKKVYAQPLKVDVVTGAAMFVKTAAFNKIGGFDTEYFLYCEEEDLCKRMVMNGFDVFLVPEARFIHHSGKSSRPGLSMMKENAISKLRYHQKFAGGVGYFFVWLYLIFKYLKKGLKNKDYLKLTWFIITGAPSDASLRHTQ